MTLKELSNKSFVINLGNIYSVNEILGQTVKGVGTIKLESLNKDNPLGVFVWRITFKLGNTVFEHTINLHG